MLAVLFVFLEYFLFFSLGIPLYQYEKVCKLFCSSWLFFSTLVFRCINMKKTTDTAVAVCSPAFLPKYSHLFPSWFFTWLFFTSISSVYWNFLKVGNPTFICQNEGKHFDISINVLVDGRIFLFMLYNIIFHTLLYSNI